MCGHIGTASLNRLQYVDLRKYFEKALYVDAIRGIDGTGICMVPWRDLDDNSPFIYKKAMPSYDFLNLEPVQDILSEFRNFQVAIGHNRATTRGGNNVKNTHPFNTNHIYLAHNGTLSTFRGLDATEISDSRAICKAFAEKGVVETLEQLDGAYALVWYDAEKHTLNFTRNKERPLYFVMTKSFEQIIWASEDWMLDALSPHGMELDDTVYTVRPGTWLSFDLSGQKKLNKWDLVEYSVYTPPKPKHSHRVNDKRGKGGKNRGAKGKEADMLLAFSGYRRGQPVVFEVTDFLTDENQMQNKSPVYVKGTIKGDLLVQPTGNTTDQAICYHATKYDYDRAIKDNHGYVTGFIQDARLDKDSHNIIYVVAHLRPVDWDRDFLEPKNDEDLNDGTPFGDYGDADLLVGPNNHAITITDWYKLVGGGCVGCGSDINIRDAEEVYWDKENSPYCPDCSERFFAQRVLGFDGNNTH